MIPQGIPWDLQEPRRLRQRHDLEAFSSDLGIDVLAPVLARPPVTLLSLEAGDAFPGALVGLPSL